MLTVSTVEPVTPLWLALIVVVPEPRPRWPGPSTRLAFEIVATPVSDDDQVTVAVRSWVVLSV